MNTTATIKTFGGELLKLSHDSKVNGCKMDLNVFVPPNAPAKVPVLFFLSGLTCTGNNCAEKGFLHPFAAKHGIAIVYPDTSPRGHNIPGEDDSWDFGSGAGFYLNATKEPYKGKYNMYQYITEELPALLWQQFPQFDKDNVGITGHSMGGHGALTLFLKNPGMYKSVSAFSPISNPKNCPWGDKAFSGYLNDKSEWDDYDASELIKKYKGPTPGILIDCGTADNFYTQGQLLPENLVAASKGTEFDGKVDLRLQDGYDHSYYFISTFAEDHVNHAAKYLTASKL
ncbi:Alpha/Beta hydrolase protein [Yarrowia lipolytica]|uniref:S-formylglutathione hydrolase n=1 Tax=Yarrowia lipolytica TaxID=4952 RepID=A0A371C2X4_YARLL|nr:Alpha/Beta hydrolase protein [Yarrowia lipolytica]RDW30638.1 Alpha/Beta hydrolase protein [Yarrowia lipolytica]RDW39778.1 Alpha/Beta hydrolase protein [Yarrowia lipolytica]RDW47160.1 Alpha/Beta hydrolase protein [Yarrowia lipolytica]RDW53387.1 Alpha/Beta hydrolase protein [Yarrowia lipolytica]